MVWFDLVLVGAKGETAPCGWLGWLRWRPRLTSSNQTHLYLYRLLVRVLQGESVVLSGLDDADLRAGLEGVLEALGLELRKATEGEEEEEGYTLPRACTERVEAAWRMGGLVRLFSKRGTVPAEVGEGWGWACVCLGVGGWVGSGG